MSSPNEPGYPRAGDRPGSSNGSGTGAAGADGASAAGKAGGVQARPAGGQITETGEAPPWQRGTARTTPPAPNETRDEGARPASAHSPGVEARLQRFVAGSENQETEQQARPARPSSPQAQSGSRGEPARSEAYASEIPDLSGPAPRPAPRKSSADAPAARSSSNSPTTRIQVASRTAHQGPVRASMQIRRVDPWTVLKVSLVLSVVLFFVWMIAVAFLYLVLGAMGVWSKLNSNVGDLLTSASGAAGGELVSSGTIFGGAALIGLVNIVVLCAMATIGAFIYNLTTDLVGGVEVTLADRD
ncbi:MULTISPECIES: DUF3566 domain-containing protein [Mycolicibacterium]|uniref:Transmembrane domain of uncharacterized function (DUF3566) n=1 Tax=Mycolicibacterium senegalense TaxID=1796 RepID=A0A378W7F1_9MYCO|nr:MULTISPECIES: DUF3566 domain-containing protein [Mycolicibacterium]MCV7337388.1 DUF3566 domain-containing protein [Mycolicibacterium senegalense]MDR7287517.1 hypothetical protein [Mycolicibacterium senegalense]QZA24564.1 DUF3566 domain-containing protein [Mycolicibacterium senegalense]CDP87255.1 hypothetical protein BN975_03275 [Mycolicibacterium farcinogenes]SUA28906.1 Transmembrane domain of uncharacterised function (DUF3566) [Mycolicibacterium senegalense]